jgi:predicted AlkP superfamily phosphohydrolase/phosphomutase
MSAIRTFIEDGGYEIITLNDGSKYERLIVASDENEQLRKALQELSGYVRSHLAGQNADPELEWALKEADDILDGNA